MTDNNGITNTNNNFNNSDSAKYNMVNNMGSYYPNQQYNHFNGPQNNQFPMPPNEQNNYNVNSQMFSNQNNINQGNSNQNGNMNPQQSMNQNRPMYDINVNKQQSQYPQQSTAPNNSNNLNNYPPSMNHSMNNGNSLQQQQRSQIYPNVSFVFSSEMANKAVCDVNEKKYDSVKSWHISNYGHPSQYGNEKKIEQNSGRGIKRKMSPNKEQPNTFAKPLPISSTNGIHTQETNGNFPQSNSYGNLSVPSRTYSKDDDNPLRRMERMTQETLNEPPTKIPIRGNNNSINGDNNLTFDQRKAQEKQEKLEKLNQMEKVFGIDKTRKKEEWDQIVHDYEMQKYYQGNPNNPNGYMPNMPMNMQQNMRQNGPPNLGPPYLPNNNMPPPNRPGSQPLPGNQRPSQPTQQQPQQTQQQQPSSGPFYPPAQNRMNQFPNQQIPNSTSSTPMMPSPQMYPMGSGGQINKPFIPPSSVPQSNNMRGMPMNGMAPPNMSHGMNQGMNPNMGPMRQPNMQQNIPPNVNSNVNNQMNIPNGVPNHPLQNKMPVPNNMNVMSGQNNRLQNMQNPGIPGGGMQGPGIPGQGMPPQNRQQQNMPPPGMQGPNSMGSIPSQQQQNMSQMMMPPGQQNNQRYPPNQQISNQMMNGQNGMVPQGNGQSNMMRPNYDMNVMQQQNPPQQHSLPPEGYINVSQHNAWPQQHNLPRPLTNIDSRVPVQKMQYSPQLMQETMASIN
uniref:NUFIP1 domain-containing protein n=1 Tax=Parastrongyloides trichosuri TaxID=131310 RepID=A0A0N4ZBY4_PARTI